MFPAWEGAGAGEEVVGASVGEFHLGERMLLLGKQSREKGGRRDRPSSRPPPSPHARHLPRQCPEGESR